MPQLWNDAIALLAVLIMLAVIALLIAGGLLAIVRRTPRRRRAQIAQMRWQEEQLRTLSRAVEQSPSAVIITNLDGSIEYVNPKFTAVTGYTLEEVKGQNPRILKSGYTSDEEYTRLWNTILSGGEWRGQFLNKKKNGEVYWEAASISAVKSSDGRITHYVAVKEDITSRKEAEEQVVRQNRELTLLNRVIETATSTLDMVEMLTTICRDLALAFDVPQAATALLNTDGTTYEVVAEYLAPGRTSALGVHFPVTGNRIADHIMDHRAPFVLADVRTDSRWPATPENRQNIKARGTISMLIVPLLVNDELIGTIGLDSVERRVFTDDEIVLASRVAAALSQSLHNTLLYRQLHASESRLKATLDNASLGIALLDPQGRYIRVNNRWIELFNYQVAPLSHHSYFDFIHPDDTPTFREKLEAMQRGDMETFLLEVRLIRRSGDVFWGEIAVSSIWTPEGQLEAVV
ncbi:MAG: PAS domain S-box protein, partial [Chloroflexi bacterium]